MSLYGDLPPPSSAAAGFNKSPLSSIPLSSSISSSSSSASSSSSSTVSNSARLASTPFIPRAAITNPVAIPRTLLQPRVNFIPSSIQQQKSPPSTQNSNNNQNNNNNNNNNNTTATDNHNQQQIESKTIETVEPSTASPPLISPNNSISSAIINGIDNTVSVDVDEDEELLSIFSREDCYDPRRPNEYEQYAAWKEQQKQYRDDDEDRERDSGSNSDDSDDDDDHRRGSGYQYHYHYDADDDESSRAAASSHERMEERRERDMDQEMERNKDRGRERERDRDGDRDRYRDRESVDPWKATNADNLQQIHQQQKQELLSLSSGEDAYQRRMRMSQNLPNNISPSPLPPPPPSLPLPPPPPPTKDSSPVTNSRVILLTVSDSTSPTSS